MLSPEHERDLAILEGFIGSPAEGLIARIIEEAYGAEAQLRQIDAAVQEIPLGSDQSAVVTQIRAASHAAHDVLDRARERLKTLRDAKQRGAKAAPMLDRFMQFRRVGRIRGD